MMFEREERVIDRRGYRREKKRRRGQEEVRKN